MSEGFWTLQYVNGPWDKTRMETTLKPVDFDLAVDGEEVAVGFKKSVLWRYEVGPTVEGITLIVGRVKS